MSESPVTVEANDVPTQAYLAPELVAKIVEHGHDIEDKQAPNIFSLVCRSWCLTFRSKLFSTLTLRSLRDVDDLFRYLHAVPILGLPPISSYVSSLCCYFAFREDTAPWLHKMYLMLQHQHLNNVHVCVKLATSELSAGFHHRILPHTVPMVHPYCHEIIVQCPEYQADILGIYYLVSNLHVSDFLVLNIQGYRAKYYSEKQMITQKSEYGFYTLPKYANSLYYAAVWSSSDSVLSSWDFFWGLMCLLGNKKINGQVYSINAQDVYAMTNLLHELMHVKHPSERHAVYMYIRIGWSMSSSKHTCEYSHRISLYAHLINKTIFRC